MLFLLFSERFKNLVLSNSRSKIPKFMAMFKLSMMNIDRIYVSVSHRNWFVTSFLKFKDFRKVLKYVSCSGRDFNENCFLVVSVFRSIST